MQTITFNISEEDTEKAGNYGDNDNCLLATALRREGYDVESVGGTAVRLANGTRYRIDGQLADDLATDENYPQAFAGRKVELTFLNRWK